MDDAEPEVALSYVDLLYAVPVADLAMRVADTHLQDVKSVGWSDVALAMTAITFGWVGHHTAYQQSPRALKALRKVPQPFFKPRFVQFLIEIAIIGVYFALGTRVVLPNDHGIKQPDELWKGACLVAIYCLYLVWDLLDIGIASMEASSATRDGRAADALELRRWALKATRGMTVTVVFLLVFGVFLGIGISQRHHHVSSGMAVGFDVAAIACLYGYRALQGRVVAHGWKSLISASPLGID
jgi:hypothetical protein